MIQSELYVLSRLAQIRSTLPATADHHRLPAHFLGLSHHRREPDQRHARHHRAVGDGPLRPQAPLPADSRRGPGGPGGRPGARVPRRGRPAPALGGAPRASVTSPRRSAPNNLVAPAGMHEENHTLYLTVVDGRVHSIAGHRGLRRHRRRAAIPVRIRDFAAGASGARSRCSTSSRPTGTMPCCSTSAASPTAAPSTSPRRSGRRSRAPAGAAAGHEAGLLLRPVADRPGIGATASGKHYLRARAVGPRSSTCSSRAGAPRWSRRWSSRSTVLVTLVVMKLHGPRAST